MGQIITQSVEFDGITAQDLFDTYLDARKHGAALGAAAAIHPVVGGEFQAFDGNLRGRLLEIVPGRLIVQSWRGKPWRDDDLDSIVILNFVDAGGGARIDLVHANIPAHAEALVNAEAWYDRYWTPWKCYFARQRSQRA